MARKPAITPIIRLYRFPNTYAESTAAHFGNTVKTTGKQKVAGD
jgi:hypothetical protein